MILVPAELTSEQHSVCTGLALLYIKVNGGPDKYTACFYAAVRDGDSIESERLSACLISRIADHLPKDTLRFVLSKLLEAFSQGAEP